MGRGHEKTQRAESLRTQRSNVLITICPHKKKKWINFIIVHNALLAKSTHKQMQQQTHTKAKARFLSSTSSSHFFPRRVFCFLRSDATHGVSYVIMIFALYSPFLSFCFSLSPPLFPSSFCDIIFMCVHLSAVFFLSSQVYVYNKVKKGEEKAHRMMGDGNDKKGTAEEE